MPDAEPAGAAEDFSTALAIARAIAADAVWWDDMCAFIGATPADRPHLPARQAVLGGDLYEGSAGIARFLAHAAVLADDASLRDTALGAVRHALARSQGFSLHSGRLGAGLVGLEIAARLDVPALVQPAVEAIELASEAALAAGGGAAADLLSGTAGVILGLIEALPYDLDGGWLARAFDLGRLLLQTARPAPLGACWALAPGHADHLCGLAHGAAGVALALSRLAALAPDQPGWITAAAAARGFERGWFSPDHGSWADLRTDPGAGSQHAARPYPHFWCHGSVGIGQERLMAVAAGIADPPCRADAVAALAGMTAEARRIIALPAGPGGSDRINASQCHGLSGMVDLLAEAWRLEHRDSTLQLMRQLTAFMRNDAGPARRWRSGIPGGGQPTPGLMLGSAGVGWAHLRAWNPARVPNAWLPTLPAPAGS